MSELESEPPIAIVIKQSLSETADYARNASAKIATASACTKASENSRGDERALFGNLLADISMENGA